eukprot:1147929-Pelagomonas_calceolata.AAC.1
MCANVCVHHQQERVVAEYLSSNCSSFDFPALRAYLESPRYVLHTGPGTLLPSMKALLGAVLGVQGTLLSFSPIHCLAENLKLGTAVP